MRVSMLSGVFYLLTVTACVSSSEIETGSTLQNDGVVRSQSFFPPATTVRTTTDTDVTEKYLKTELSLANGCESDADCHHEGKCEGAAGQKVCRCLKGTSGDRCKVVDECVNNKCGTGEDVQCVFDILKESALCVCDNDTKKFDDDYEICRVPCTDREGCGDNGDCMESTNSTLEFCACYLGVSGDRCQTIDQCHSKEVDCGDDPTLCTVNSKGKAYCKCPNVMQGFDYDAKVCKDCDCGPFYGCQFRNGKKSCTCAYKYYFDGNTCKECGCGRGGSTCSLINGTKTCNCYSGYKQQMDTCQRCECGSNSDGNCTFKESKKVCTCKPGFTLGTYECTEVCNSTHPCQHGGVCVGYCKCPLGLSGGFCQTVNECTQLYACGYYDDAVCYYDMPAQKALCRCKLPKQHYIPYSKRCKDCDCGVGSSNCSYDIIGSKVCTCKEGYAFNYDECLECSCGPFGKCKIYGSRKVCSCDPGYIEYNGICKRCDCGTKGRCDFNRKGEKECKCNGGYFEYRGTCKECDCGWDGECGFDYMGKKECHCHSGYGDSNGHCQACNCGLPDANCTFGTIWKDCICPKGYRPHITDRNRCVDVDECLEYYICPDSTECVNTVGSYSCDCKPGYEWKTPKDPKVDGCDDIDECSSYTNCYSYTTKCVNTPGSYRCLCRQGYVPANRVDDYSDFAYCSYDGSDSGWRTAYSIVGGMFLAFSLLLISIIIFKKLRAGSR